MQVNQPFNRPKYYLRACGFVLSLLLAGHAMAQPAQRLIIKYKDSAQLSSSQGARIQNMMSQLSANSGSPMMHLREMGLKDQHVIQLTKRQSRGAFLSLIKSLRSQPNVVSVEEDSLMQPNLIPNDEFYSLQWHYYEATGGMNAQEAWDTHNGAGVIVAIIDTGITNHSDLNANVLPGYDFISDLDVSNDGDLRDSDASDPGDWVATFECGFNGAQNSSWHGTHTAGTVAAITDNTQGVAGVAYGANILPVRVLGKCGGFLSDIADAVIWASGGSVAGVPDNANPAQIINMSLGGGGSCDSIYQDAIDIAVANGTTVVVSAGNSSADAVNFRPASCNSVITVAANDRGGNLASYSNFGAIVDVTAPGGETVITADGVASTLNDGATTPNVEAYVYYQGTSMSAPHVAGAAALLYEADPSITPAQVESALKATSRPMPGSCTGGCGAGIIDARAALDSLGTPANIDPSAGFTFTVDNLDVIFTDTSSDSDGTIASWSWDFGDGNSSTLQNPSNTYASAGNYTVTLTVTDDQGATDSTNQSVSVNDGGGSTSGGFTITDVSPALREILSFNIDVPANADSLVVDTSGGNGDVDLAINFGSTPTRNNSVCLENSSGNTHNCTVSNPQAGTWFIIVRGAQASSGVQLDAYWFASGASNLAPVADFSFTTNELEATFTDSSTDSDGSIVAWDWDFGDGSTSTNQNPINTYSTAGSYTAELTVTDDQGATATTSQTVTVSSSGGGNSGGFTITGISPTSGQNLSYTIDVPAGSTSLLIDTSGGTGDVDLAVNFGSSPTPTNNECIEQGAGNVHNCTLINPAEGTWFIIVRGASTSTDVQLDAYWFN